MTVSSSGTDPDSGIASSSGCGTTTLSAETAGTTLTCTVTNTAGLSSTLPFTVRIDKTPPTLNPSGPLPIVLLDGPTTVQSNATDALSGVAAQSCAPLDTSSVGARTEACTATDLAGNTLSAQMPYTVTYGRQLRYNTAATYQSGAPVTLTIALSDAHNAVVSAPSIPVTATAIINSAKVVVRSVTAPFTYLHTRVYQYIVDSTGLPSGQYALHFRAGSDPLTHSAPFTIG